MEYLNIKGNSISDVGRNHLSGSLFMNNMSSLSVLTDDKFDMLATTNAQLLLSGRSINDAEAKLLAAVLRHNGALTTLHLAGNQIGNAGAISLSEGHKNNTAPL